MRRWPGAYGVPVVLITGDRTIVEETTRALPWAVGVAVKDAIGYSSVNSLTPQAARTRFAPARARRWGESHARDRSLRAHRSSSRSRRRSVEHADFIELMPGFARIGGRARCASRATEYPAASSKRSSRRRASPPRPIRSPDAVRLYISSDMEGVAGVCAWEQVDARRRIPTTTIYRRYYTQEVHSAIEGARAGGASGVLVNDAHGPMRNLLLDDLPDDVRVIFGNRKPFSMVQDADGGFGGAFFFGLSRRGRRCRCRLVPHVYSLGHLRGSRLNGIRCSEATLNAALLGYYGVPLLAGDGRSHDGRRRSRTDAVGARRIVKDSIGNRAAASMPPAAACRAIRASAEEAIRDAAERELYRFEAADRSRRAARHRRAGASRRNDPGFERTGSRSVRFVDDDFAVVFKAFVAIAERLA